MSRKNRPLVRSIVSFIGIDYPLLKRSGEDNVVKFYVSGFLVVLIACISFFSVFYGFDLMFHKWYAEALLSVFFSLTFLTIYLLLIQTFSKETFPKGSQWPFFNTSNITRICFVGLISFLIAQPVKIWLLRDRLDPEIATYKNALYQNFAAANARIYRNDLHDLSLQKRRYAQHAADPIFTEYITAIDAKAAAIQSQIDHDNVNAAGKINDADFFLKRVELAGRYPAAWLITALVIALFGLPVYLIYSISDNSSYYVGKKEHDRLLVLEHYRQFKKRYADLFSEKYGKTVHFHEHFQDPPFNKVPLAEPTYGTQDDFISRFLN